jgi:hypothetical protein
MSRNRKPADAEGTTILMASYDISSATALQFVVACKNAAVRAVGDYDQDELEREINQIFGYHIVDCTAAAERFTGP